MLQFLSQYWSSYPNLVGGFKHFFMFHFNPFHIWDVIVPIDKLIFFKMFKTTNQDIYIYPLTTINHHLKPPTSINPQWSHDQETRTACSLQVDEQSPGGLRAALGIYYSFLFKKYVYSLYIYMCISYLIYMLIYIYIYMIHNYINIYTHVYIFCVVSFGTPI
jgi:hypothetical protein